MCGGYYIQHLNNKDADRYVVKVILPVGTNSSNLDVWTANSVLAKGYFVKDKVLTSYYNFVVHELYRALPSNAPAQGMFYKLENLNVQCKKAPCPSYAWHLLNSASTGTVTDFSEPYTASTSFIDAAWLRARILDSNFGGRAIVQGSVQSDRFNIVRVFVRLPDPLEHCVGPIEPACKEGMVATYRRDANRCVSWNGCVKPGPCVRSLPICQQGYNLIGIPSAPNGCIYSNPICDADFLDTTF
eukprot:gene6742-7836_t